MNRLAVRQHDVRRCHSHTTAGAACVPAGGLAWCVVLACCCLPSAGMRAGMVAWIDGGGSKHQLQRQARERDASCAQ
jgi:hypothetical protein